MRLLQITVVLLPFLLVLPVLVPALLEEDELPPMLDECFSKAIISNKFTLGSQSTCLAKFLAETFGEAANKPLTHLDQRAINWIEALGLKVHVQLSRRKRDLMYALSAWNRFRPWRFPAPGRRIRKEIRALGKQERDEFFAAINALKSDTSVSPNRYDAIALYHRDEASISAHNGPNFVSWHRYYLYIFEEALRSKRPNVALPYWDSRLEFRMDNPVDSILFSDLFMGNPTGVVMSGPFANWITPGYPPDENIPLRRGAPGEMASLINPTLLMDVWRQKYNHQILRPTAVSTSANLEEHHDGVHIWVGGRDGHMTGIFVSAQDPIFYLHHCFIDYIWEVFRRNQRINGINPETDYPETNITEHFPDRIMDELMPPKKNSFGYSNFFTDHVYQYAPSPTCSNGCGGASNLYLFCNVRTYACQSRSKGEFRDLGGFVTEGITGFSASYHETMTSLSTPPNITPRFPTGIVDPRTMPGRAKRSVHDAYQYSDLQENALDTFNNIVTINIGFLTNDSISERSNDVIPYHRTALDNVTIEMIGLSYNDRYIYTGLLGKNGEKAGQKTATILIKKPTKDVSRTYIRAFHSDGSMCKPQCLNSGSQSTYRPCTGVIKATDQRPLMYTLPGQSAQGTKPFMIFNCNNI